MLYVFCEKLGNVVFLVCRSDRFIEREHFKTQNGMANICHKFGSYQYLNKQ